MDKLTETHRKGSTSSSSLGLNDLITTELNSLDEVLVLLVFDVLALADLAEEGDNGNTRVTTNDGNLDIFRVRRFDLAEESRSTDNIKGGDTEDSISSANIFCERRGKRHTASRQRHPSACRPQQRWGR